MSTASPSSPTADRLLDAAEGLFIDLGFAETSLRAVTQAAGANLAAVNYHFGSKLGLIQAVLDRRLQPMNAERLARLEQLEQAHPDGPPLRALLEAFLAPALQMGLGDGRPFFTLLARAHATPDPELQRAFVGRFADVAVRYSAALERALPGVPLPEILWRMHFIVGSMCHTVLATELLTAFSDGACRADDPAILERLTDFALAGLSSAASPEPEA